MYGISAHVLVGWKPTVIIQNELKRVAAVQRALARFVYQPPNSFGGCDARPRRQHKAALLDLGVRGGVAALREGCHVEVRPNEWLKLWPGQQRQLSGLRTGCVKQHGARGDDGKASGAQWCNDWFCQICVGRNTFAASECCGISLHECCGPMCYSSPPFCRSHHERPPIWAQDAAQFS